MRVVSVADNLLHAFLLCLLYLFPSTSLGLPSFGFCCVCVCVRRIQSPLLFSVTCKWAPLARPSNTLRPSFCTATSPVTRWSWTTTTSSVTRCLQFLET